MTRVVDEIVEDALRELSDEQSQIKLWTSSGDTEVSSLSEVKSRLWDDSGLLDEMERGVVYSDTIDAQLRRLRHLLRRLDENATVSALLANPDLATARSLAMDLLGALRALGYGRAGTSS
jgi:hypothetical protein